MSVDLATLSRRLPEPAAGVLDRFRQPEYTGENRCWPCTSVNLLIAALAAVVVGLFAWPAGVAVFVASALAIAVRGYLVPGTPTLTKRYFPPWLLGLFGKDADVVPDDVSAEAGLMESAESMARAGIITECEAVDDLCLTDEFRAAWDDRLATVREAEGVDGRAPSESDVALEDVATIFGVPAESLTLRDSGRLVRLYDAEDNHVARWESPAAYHADATAAATLAEWHPEWSALDPSERARMALALRLFVEECPECGESVAPEQKTVESCCSSYEAAVVHCDACGTKLLEESLQ